jgi:hypothetical protein
MGMWAVSEHPDALLSSLARLEGSFCHVYLTCQFTYAFLFTYPCAYFRSAYHGGLLSN